MKVVSKKSVLAGHIVVPGSKSHTIRSLILAAMGDGVSHIYNPLRSNDCLSTVEAIRKIGAEVTMEDDCWTVTGAGQNLHIPEGPINVGNSGSLMYFLAPVLATLKGECTFTGDESICKRPVGHLLDALKQLGVKTKSLNHNNMPPFVFTGPMTLGKSNNGVLHTEGALSQYISGFMMAAARLDGTLEIELENPQETPYLTMTKYWLENVGVKADISEDFKKISVSGSSAVKSFDKVIPSDWEGIAFPLISALLSCSEITIDNVDSSGTQGDAAIVEILKSVGANIIWNTDSSTLAVKKTKRLSTKGLPKKVLRIDISAFPDAICALSVISCFIEGKTIISNVGICRQKETDRVTAMTEILTSLGADIKDEGDSLVIMGHSQFNEDGIQNPLCKLHGGKIDIMKDHRIAMALACFGLGLKNGEAVEIKDGECCDVSFPHFFGEMNKLGANFGLSE